MNYQVKTFRDAGLEAKWTKTPKGSPVIVARDPNGTLHHQRTTWFYVDSTMLSMMSKEGIVAGFRSATLIAHYFSL